jgi:hypothetical protein
VTTTFKRHIAVAIEDFSWTSPDYYPILVIQPIFGNWDCTGSASLLSSYLRHHRKTQSCQLVHVVLDLLL